MNLFQTKEYLAIFARHFCRPEDIVDGIWEKYQGKLVLLGMKPVLGGQEVTDFGPEDLTSVPAGAICLDYIKEGSLTFNKFKSKAVKQEVSPYLDLPQSWQEYLAGLERKYRKEIKRKFRRLEEARPEFVAEPNLDEFIRLHRLSDPRKQKFMGPEMKMFFRDVASAAIPGWQKRLDFLKIDGHYAASTVSFISQDEWWLYNSGYDPQFNYFSPGVVLKAQTVRWAIEQGKNRYDFLRGSERYKYELGAKDLNLYRMEITQ